MYYARLIAVQLEMSALAAMQYRVGFWSEGLLGALWSSLGMAPLFVAVEHFGAVKGWGRWDLVVLTGCFMTLSGTYGALLQPSLIESMNHIRRGTLDYVLLRPGDAMVLCLTSSFRLWQLLEVLCGALLIVVGASMLGRTPGVMDVLAATATGLTGLVALYAFGVLVLCASFRAMQLQSLTYVLESLLDFGRWPAQVFPGPLRALFTFVVPILVMTSYPAEALLGRLEWSTISLLACASTVLLAAARWLWRRSIREYTSASS